MATRSRIAVETTNRLGEKVVKSVYCHNDGYVDGVGIALMRRFPNGTDLSEVEEFVNEGDRSTVELSYKAWRGENCPPKKHGSVPAFFDSDIEAYGYLFTNEGEWLVKKAFLEDQEEPVQLAYVLSGTVKL